MGKKMSSDDCMDSMSAVQEYLREFSQAARKKVIAQRGGDTIFNGEISVSIGYYHNYYNVNIEWEDKEPQYHEKGLFGYYSTDYCKMKYSKKVLTILSNDIVITIS